MITGRSPSERFADDGGKRQNQMMQIDSAAYDNTEQRNGEEMRYL